MAERILIPDVFPDLLRASPENGPSWDDPSEDLLFMLLEDIEAGEGTFLIVERTNDADRHYGTQVTDMREAHELLTGLRSSCQHGATRPPGLQLRYG